MFVLFLIQLQSLLLHSYDKNKKMTIEYLLRYSIFFQHKQANFSLADPFKILSDHGYVIFRMI